jgi:hypothetical protein
MGQAGKPFADEFTIERCASKTESGFRAHVNGTVFWQESKARCATEDTARELASVAYGRRLLLADITDVLVWLLDENPRYRGDLFCDRYRHQSLRKTISCAVIYHDDRAFREYLTMRAETAFQALGWAFDHSRWSELEWLGSRPVDELSAHERLRSIERVRKAMLALNSA